MASALSASGTLNISGASTFGSILAANTVTAQVLGNAGATLTGTLTAGAQNNITSATGLTTLAATNGNIANLASNYAAINNLSTANIQATGGSVTGISNLSTAALVATGATTLAALTATTVTAPTIGNTGAIITGTLNTAAQNNLTTANNLVGVGTINTGVWQANVVAPAYGGTGVNNGSSTLTLSGSYTLNQSVASGAAPAFVGTNFTGNASGMTAGRVVNGVYTTDAWSNPAWITNINWNKLTGTAPVVSTFNNDAGYVSVGLGLSQTWQNVKASRAGDGTTYTNSTGKPIQVSIVVSLFSGTSASLVIGGVVVASAAYTQSTGTSSHTAQLSAVVPASTNYSLTLAANLGVSPTISQWAELR
jgi:hypothetical protein